MVTHIKIRSEPYGKTCVTFFFSNSRGLGNDFVIIDQRDSDFELNKSQIKSICDRKKIGCDQLILVKKSEKVDAYLIFKNSDGSDSAACGNGTRCVASLLSKENAKSEITFETKSGILKSKILNEA